MSFERQSILGRRGEGSSSNGVRARILKGTNHISGHPEERERGEKSRQRKEWAFYEPKSDEQPLNFP